MAIWRLSVIFLSLFTVWSSANPQCDTHVDCKTCVNNKSWIGKNCRWCPLDRNCHADGSPLNPCLQNQNVKDAAKCQEMKYGKYDPKAAFSYTLMSAAAYTNDPQKCLRKIYPTGDFVIKNIIRHSCEDLPLFKYEECFAYTAVSNKKRIIAVAFRGTVINSLQIYDQIISILTTPKTSFPTGGNVQRYFANAYQKLYQGVNASVTSLVRQYPAYDVVVTGHSLGGAIASLAAVSLVYQKLVPVNRMYLYTYGLPRVGDKQYALNHDRLLNNSWRVVHNRDIVSHLPTCNIFTGCFFPSNGPYHHRTEVFYPDQTMNQGSQYIQCKGDDDEKCSDGMITRKPCIIDLSKCIKYHEYYFGIRVGTLCDGS
ncbi:lipase ZK262.3-like [Mercenaria mercenaria]|uniref:lipase ZK262.3-like n=1 Tax=Mercenaria mercenaria TaxID=6596 RepID=UPI00234FA81C|nr:lipase ZK262.3-like [Mercenaria mercenaria]